MGAHTHTTNTTQQTHNNGKGSSLSTKAFRTKKKMAQGEPQTPCLDSSPAAAANPRSSQTRTEGDDAEERAFEISLTRNLILHHKLELEKLTRTDEDIHEAVDGWLKDAAAAERRYGHISEWDVSQVTDMSGLFRVRREAEALVTNSFNEDLSRWNTGNVTDMSEMFAGARNFTSDLSQWQTGKVTNMRQMFWASQSFTSDLSKWETGSVTDMSEMFHCAGSFASDVSEWQTGNVTDMSHMFAGSRNFNSDLSKWQTGNVTSMEGMFTFATSLQQRPRWYDSWRERQRQ